MMKIYLDNCSFNRPFDDQSRIGVYLETEALNWIFSGIRSGRYLLAWSFVLDYEIRKNPDADRRAAVMEWRVLARDFCLPGAGVSSRGEDISRLGVGHVDALHVAAAIEMGCRHFITTDRRVFNKAVPGIRVVNPVDFVVEMEASDED